VSSSTASTPADRWPRVKQLFAEALELPPEERAAFVAAACSQDAELGREVGELLYAHTIEDGFIEQTAAEHLGWASGATEDWTGRRIGPYRVIAEAGRGGLSRVFRAVREDGDVEQQVAIKLLHAALGADALTKRFRAERRLLSRLSHPSIAHFLDAGATDDGAPYLVMEFVDGEPIDEYCEVRALGLPARLELFRALCGAVHHVHQNLMVHGDIKGGNVLVTRDGVVKLLDFGIAKLLDPAAGDTGRPATLLMMTPEYASPEQLRGEAITTASDVYSLGALLYRLLAGTTPFADRAAGARVAAARNSSDGPLAPSVVAARAGGVHAACVPALRAELDAVVLKALKSDPRERYGSAEQLADDLQRYLHGFPVEARPDSLGYRLAKFARRHAVATFAGGLAVASLVGGVGVATWQAHVARVERERAERHFTAVRQLSATFLGDVYDAIVQIPGSTAARKLLVDRSLEYLAALERDAQDSVELRRDLGKAWERLADVQGAILNPSLGEREQSFDSYRRSLAHREALVQESPALEHRLELLGIQVTFGEALVGAGETQEARAVLDGAIRNAAAVLAAGATGKQRRKVAAAYVNHGWLEWASGQADSGLASLQRALELYEDIAAGEPQDGTARRDLALAYGRIGEAHMSGTGRREEALRHYQQAYRILESLLREAPDNLELQRMRTYTRVNIGHLHVMLRQPREALRELEPELETLDGWRQADAADALAPLALGVTLNLVGESRLQLGEFDAAANRFAAAARYLRPELVDSPDDLRVVYAQMLAGAAQAGFGQARMLSGAARSARLAEAQDSARRAVALLEPLTGRASVALEAKRILAGARAVLAQP
jgi:eukaryotic-like serine/threonine-protein kinase